MKLTMDAKFTKYDKTKKLKHAATTKIMFQRLWNNQCLYEKLLNEKADTRSFNQHQSHLFVNT